MQSAPFFTNDLPGTLKVAGFLIAIVGSMWTFLRGDLMRKDASLDQRITTVKGDIVAQIDGLGRRVDGIATACTQTATEVEGLKTRAATMEHDQKHQDEGIAEVKARLDAMVTTQFESKTEIVAHITEASRQQLLMTSQTNERIAVLEGQMKSIAGTIAGVPSPDRRERKARSNQDDG